MLRTISITVSGKVQGVFFRQSTKDVATTLGITGQVMNVPDGNVHLIATGTKEQLDKFITWCRQGPPKAKVTGIEVQDISLQSFDKFSIQRF
ncbi:MAG: acylphosphatase [Chitinophagaceae bacterium]